MNPTKRPVSVLVISWLYIAVGVVGFAYHFRELMALQHNSLWIELIELLAVIAGTFLLRGRNWARWLTLVWMGFHVVINLPALRQVVPHALFLAVITWLLFRAEARRYFRGEEVQG